MSDSTQNPPPPDETNQYSSPPPPPPGGSYQSASPAPDHSMSQPMGQSLGKPGSVGQPADLMNRFLARLIDFVLLAIVNGVLVSAIIVGAFMGADAGGFGYGAGTSLAASAVTALLSAAISLCYFAYLESSRGQTVGKMLLKLETRGPGGGRPTMEQALKRNAFVALGVLAVIPVLGWLLSSLAQLAAVIMIAVTINNNTATRRGWHDEFAGGTSVVKVG